MDIYCERCDSIAESYQICDVCELVVCEACFNFFKDRCEECAMKVRAQEEMQRTKKEDI